jgi:nitroimidazol reductase NimA-like FMN-containing flavoprotein (pyridoxamine 5'-phosphate oxidase superfamily)
VGPSPILDPAERPAALAVLDEAPLCHVGFIESGEPVVLPALHGRVGDTLYLHGSPDGALLRAVAAGKPLCVNAVLLDGVAVARCPCHSALNYRSVLFSGRGCPVDDPAEKELALRAITERITPGAWERGRPPTPAAVAGTAVVALAITDISLRARTGPPHDDEADLALPCWAGVVALRLAAGPAVPEPGVPAGLAAPPVLGSR